MGLIQFPTNAVAYLDSQVFIYSVERRERFAAITNEIWSAHADSSLAIVTSELTLMECLVFPLRGNHTSIVEAFESLFSSSWLRIVPITRDILRAAASLRAKNSAIKAPDAIHLATADSSACNVIITNDHKWKATRGDAVLVLDDLIAPAAE